MQQRRSLVACIMWALHINPVHVPLLSPSVLQSKSNCIIVTSLISLVTNWADSIKLHPLHTLATCLIELKSYFLGHFSTKLRENFSTFTLHYVLWSGMSRASLNHPKCHKLIITLSTMYKKQCATLHIAEFRVRNVKCDNYFHFLFMGTTWQK